MSLNLAPSLATVLTEYCSPVQPGDYVTIVGNSSTCSDLTEALFKAILKQGGFPNIQAASLMSPDYTDYLDLYLREASDEQLDHLDSTMMHWVNISDAIFFLKASTNTKTLSAIDPARISRFRRALSPFSERYLARQAAGELRWTVVGWPTVALAQIAEMSLHDYETFVATACGLDQPDPIAYWQAFRAKQERLVAWLQGKKHAEVRGPGIELSFDFEDRPWVSCHGERNFPDGEIFTSPVEDSVNGLVAFSYPSVYIGYEVEGVKIRFENGVAVEASAAKNEAYLLSQLNIDAGARRLGEFAIGTNHNIQRMTRSILFDEKIGGSIHMALGRSYEQSGGLNQSVIHWDMVHDMRAGGEISIDGELFYRSGKFMID